MARPTVAFFVMAEDGHVRRLLPLVAAVAARGVRARVWTHSRFAEDVARVGGDFGDLFAGRPLESADAESMPVPSRFVTFAGVHGEAVLSDVARDRPDLVVHDSFAVVGRVIANRLGLPCIHACAGHAVDPRRFLPVLATDPRVRVSDRCRAAAETLRDRWGMADASPFAYVAPPSRDLNVYGEPPEWLSESERAAFEPVAFFGCLPDEAPAPEPRRDGAETRLFASFGTVVQRYYAAEALAALEAVAAAVAKRPHVRAVLGAGASLSPDASARLTKANVSVLPFAEQRLALSQADVFVTHHGLNSTHEAIWHGVPMLSYPFFWDQPALAQRCRQFGLAVPLTSVPRAPLTEARVGEVLDDVLAHRVSLQDRLSEARTWEVRVMAGRAAVVDRMLGLLRRL
jgi:MGT family glycosyltransferase